MEQYNPPSPGEVILEIFLRPQGISGRQCAAQLGVPASTFQRILNGKSRIDQAMAQRLATGLGSSAESWLAMQHNYDRWIAKQKGSARAA
jgi:addiction module HigA family antidote